MNEWTVITIIITLTGFLASIITPIIKANSTITRLNTTIIALEKKVETLAAENTICHDRLWAIQREQDKQLTGHEIRISAEEKRKGKA